MHKKKLRYKVSHGSNSRNFPKRKDAVKYYEKLFEVENRSPLDIYFVYEEDGYTKSDIITDTINKAYAVVVELKSL